MRLGYEPLLYEDIVGTPEEVAEGARWLSGFSTPRGPHSLKRLTGWCLYGAHVVPVGEKFRWDDEEIRLDETRVTTARAWMGMSKEYRWVLPCPDCGKNTQIVRRGVTWA